jgi:hypothetical protein
MRLNSAPMSAISRGPLSGATASVAPDAARCIAATVPAIGRLSRRATNHASATAPITTSAAKPSAIHRA